MNKESILSLGDGDTIIKISNKFKVINYKDAVVNTSSILYEAEDGEFYEEDFDVKISLKGGDTIAILDNPGSDSDEYILEISGEVRLLKDTIVYSDGDSGEEISTVGIPVGDNKFINLGGEYFIIDGDDLDRINKDLNKKYKIAFASPC